MRIVDRKAFLALPEGTFYAKCERFPSSLGFHGTLSIKYESYSNDWRYIDVVDIEPSEAEQYDVAEALIDAHVAMQDRGASYPMCNSTSREGLFDEDQLFLIFERDDLLNLRGLVDAAISVSGVD